MFTHPARRPVSHGSVKQHGSDLSLSAEPASKQRHAGNIDYRPDIDGLRAFAVLSVLAFHAFPTMVPGGFVGVDVFFVISGFLISGIILTGIRRGTFTFSQFYARRIRRIFPALVIVLAFSLFCGWTLLLPADFRRLGNHVAAGAGFVSNIALWRESGYFDTASELKPLLHLWSLGIEEQYYLVWPLMLMLGAAYLHRLLAVILGVALLSFVVNVGVTHAHPSAAFYLPVTRFWELMVGSLLAYVQLFYPSLLDAAKEKVTAQRRADAIAFGGCCLLIAAVVLIDEQASFPGWWALLPTVGTATLIATGGTSWVSRRMLSNRAAVYVGLISYPLYLWHWPLLTFARIVEGSVPPPWVRIVILTFAFALASLTYHWVEIPIRKSTAAGRGSTAVAGLSLAMVIVTACAIPVMIGRWTPVASSYPRVADISEAVSDWETSHNGTLHGDTADAVMFFGDSHMQQYWPRIAQIMREHQAPVRSVVFFGEGGCAPIPDIDRRGYQCKKFVDSGFARARQADVKSVVVGASWPGLIGRTDLYRADNSREPLNRILDPQQEWVFRGLEAQLADLRARGKTIVIVLSSPRSPSFDPDVMLRRVGLWKWTVELSPPLNRKDHEALTGAVDTRLLQIAQRVGATTIDPADWLCSAEECPAVTDDGRPRYKDFSHLRASFVRDGFKGFDNLIYVSRVP